MKTKDKLIYICHEYGGKQENADKVAGLIERLIKAFPKYCFLSPIHATGFLYDAIPYDEGMEHCLTLLDMCDECWVFGSKSWSNGCIIEKEYCQRYQIPIVEWGEYND